MGTPWELYENILAIDKNTRNFLLPTPKPQRKKLSPQMHVKPSH